MQSEAPTCTEPGEERRDCSRCNHYETKPVSVLEHDFGAWIVTQAPTTTQSGVETRICKDCGHEETRSVAAVANPFTDVKDGAFYYKPVQWAVVNGITAGTSKTTFSPDSNCTRGQVVTFLWRAAGSPQPTMTSHSFTDVSENAFYYKAMLWAVESGITTGTSRTTFSPNADCTRGQLATFLWRAQGKPGIESQENPFQDITASSFYYTAILWAVENNITNGVGAGKFAPDANCTRGQVVTFLYRTYTES